MAVITAVIYPPEQDRSPKIHRYKHGSEQCKDLRYSDVEPVTNTGGDMTDLQEAADQGLGTFLKAVGKRGT